MKKLGLKDKKATMAVTKKEQEQEQEDTRFSIFINVVLFEDGIRIFNFDSYFKASVSGDKKGNEVSRRIEEGHTSGFAIANDVPHYSWVCFRLDFDASLLVVPDNVFLYQTFAIQMQIDAASKVVMNAIV